MKNLLRSCAVAMFCSLGFLSSSAWAVVVHVTFHAATDVPITALGNTGNFDGSTGQA